MTRKFTDGRFVEVLHQPPDGAPARLIPLEGEDALAFAVACVLEPIRERDPATRANEADLREVLQRSAARGDRFSIVLREGVPIGFVWTHADGGPDDTEIYLDEISLVRAARGAGVGAWLLGRLEAAGREAGARAIALDVLVGNARVASLYARAGYRRAGIDATGPLGRATAPVGVSAPQPDELPAAIACATARRPLTTFARRVPTPTEIGAGIRAALGVGTVRVARRGPAIVGVATWRLVPATTSSSVVCALDLHDAPPDVVPLLLDGVFAAVSAAEASEITFTLREPSDDLMAAIARRGLRAHRQKLRRPLDA